MNWRRSREYRVWRASVVRKGKVCHICKSSRRRQAHHIKNGSHHPESRYDVDNGVVLCRDCHSQLHNNYKHSYRMKTTDKDWDNFKALDNYYIQLGKLQYIKQYNRELHGSRL